MAGVMMSAAQAAAALNARLVGADVVFSAVNTDSRAIQRGDLFVALKGDRFDGHAFAAQAVASGAAAVMVQEHLAAVTCPQIVVEDTRRALGALARYWRCCFSPALIVVAGSNGKTTTKEMLAAILRRHAGGDAVLATAGNFNNDVGLPLTLLRLRGEHRYCAIEIGMNHIGETRVLADIARPSIALVTNAQREHLEFMGSVEAVAMENAAVYEALPVDGVAIVNADDPHANLFRHIAASRRVVDFGLEHAAAVSGGYVEKNLSSEIQLSTPAGKALVTLSIPGRHSVRNALAAAACATAAGVSLASIAAGLNEFRPYSGRLQVKQGVPGVTIIDDTYNANPDSVRAAIDVLTTCSAPTVLVLGDMGEVGAQGPQFHHEIGAYARNRGVSRLLAIGNATGDAVKAFGGQAVHAANMDELLRLVRECAQPGSTVLVKGSRFMRMERVVAALSERGGVADKESLH